MKETQLYFQDQTVQVAEQKKEFKKTFSQFIQPGHSVFSYNKDTGEIKKCNVQVRKDADIKGNVIMENKVYQKPNELYLPALNHKNAVKRFDKFFKHMESKNNQNEKSNS